LPLSAFNEKACTPHDLEKAALDWPELNFIVYHSGYRGTFWAGSGLGEKVVDQNLSDPQEIPWISDIFRILKKNPKIKNIYFELGSTFAQLSGSSPEKCCHMLDAPDISDKCVLGERGFDWDGGPIFDPDRRPERLAI
jgi:predicted TIM-barrel fold metal-dependent hydrolase